MLLCLTSPFFGDVTWVEIFGNVTSVVFGDVTSMAKTYFFGDVTANRYTSYRTMIQTRQKEHEV